MEELTLVRYTLASLMPLAFVSFVGAFLAHKKLFTKYTNGKISAAYSNFFNPCFVFFNVAGAVNTEKISTLWPLLMTPSLMVLVGTLLAFIHSKTFPSIPHMERVTNCIITFSNIGNLPIVLLRGICSSYGPLHGVKECDEANSYISIQLLTYSAIVWSYGYSLIAKDKEEYTRFIENNELLEEGKEINLKPVTSMWRNVLHHLLLPGPLSCIFGLIFGLIPGVNKLYDKNKALYVLADGGLTLGFAGIVLGQMTLGSNLVFIYGQEKKMTRMNVFSIVLFKNFITPIVALSMTYGFWEIGIFGSDKVMAYVVYISFCCPTAFVIMLITQTQQYGYEETSWLMFWIYAFALLSLIISTYVFFLIF